MEFEILEIKTKMMSKLLLFSTLRALPLASELRICYPLECRRERVKNKKRKEKKFNKNRFTSQNILSLLRRCELNSQERFHWEKGMVLENGVCAFVKTM